jgi:hypothetical protein
MILYMQLHAIFVNIVEIMNTTIVFKLKLLMVFIYFIVHF